jgi:CheY-like chemotaxis protein
MLHEQRSSTSSSVLVVDDSDDSAWALAVLLQSCVPAVHVAHCGRKAVDLAERFRPALIFVDLAMPEMDGFEMAMRIRRRSWGGGILLCALTGHDSPEFRDRSNEVGIDRFLAKPASWDAVRAVVSESGMA